MPDPRRRCPVSLHPWLQGKTRVIAVPEIRRFATLERMALPVCCRGVGA